MRAPHCMRVLLTPADDPSLPVLLSALQRGGLQLHAGARVATATQLAAAAGSAANSAVTTLIANLSPAAPFLLFVVSREGAAELHCRMCINEVIAM